MRQALQKTSARAQPVNSVVLGAGRAVSTVGRRQQFALEAGPDVRCALDPLRPDPHVLTNQPKLDGGSGGFARSRPKVRLCDQLAGSLDQIIDAGLAPSCLRNAAQGQRCQPSGIEGASSRPARRSDCRLFVAHLERDHPHAVMAQASGAAHPHCRRLQGFGCWASVMRRHLPKTFCNSRPSASRSSLSSAAILSRPAIASSSL